MTIVTAEGGDAAEVSCDCASGCTAVVDAHSLGNDDELPTICGMSTDECRVDKSEIVGA